MTPLREIKTQAELEGYEACYEGRLSYDQNPYELRGDLWYEWRKGYVDAEANMEMGWSEP